jgi:hypothetical protein
MVSDKVKNVAAEVVFSAAIFLDLNLLFSRVGPVFECVFCVSTCSFGKIEVQVGIEIFQTKGVEGCQ